MKNLSREEVLMQMKALAHERADLATISHDQVTHSEVIERRRVLSKELKKCRDLLRCRNEKPRRQRLTDDERYRRKLELSRKYYRTLKARAAAQQSPHIQSPPMPFFDMMSTCLSEIKTMQTLLSQLQTRTASPPSSDDMC